MHPSALSRLLELAKNATCRRRVAPRALSAGQERRFAAPESRGLDSEHPGKFSNEIGDGFVKVEYEQAKAAVEFEH
ncbi:hypothetical protein LX32DRAFT_689078 [Colletotrichum zoysiae]|uniref:Uncharacterized protein n=1 Tax=Colletotrichum zoysiae TaxID=1216348 RepID=A0AAD9HT62_9PEZI|nr:hypothetical protein LX32DRAFT_689078 [Colletotrichum zoysiae]